MMIDVAIPADSNIRNKVHKKVKKYQGLKEQLEQMCGHPGLHLPHTIGLRVSRSVCSQGSVPTPTNGGFLVWERHHK